MDYLFIALLWIGYCALHSYLISINFSRFLNNLLKNYYAFYRLFYVILSLYLLIVLINFTDQFNSPVILEYSPTGNFLKYTIMILCLIMFLWAFLFSYDPLSFFGIRQIMNMKHTAGLSPGKVSRHGLLAYTRHPMYFALIIFLAVSSVTLMDIIVNAILILYVVIGTVLEEKKLILEFGDQYRDYQQEVPMLIPFTKSKKSLTLHPK